MGTRERYSHTPEEGTPTWDGLPLTEVDPFVDLL